jgi:hypothetical protein
MDHCADEGQLSTPIDVVTSRRPRRQRRCKLGKNSPENSAVVAKAFAAVLNRPQIAVHRGRRLILTF